ncbi:nucleotidyltransferase family protein [Tindallia californiensis]|uniref:CTP:molybdopterin cytidylyltransferase MocA n=1 Tax=Tindallia californiensis TaxID=159292 RepID=A0A1H3Q3T4_9FIRM|nr:nucleotidyltransferase family protein [Tindallia californiensis]SDZ08036.1 CTP:molybdopterin cytidylyltransferase MocA [Tindallia californiensis]
MNQQNKENLNDALAVIILAAGYSSRMKAFKPLLPFGSVTVIEYIIQTFLDAGIDHIYVVAGFRKDELEVILKKYPVNIVINHHYDQGMYSSIKEGVRGLQKNYKGFLLHPVDIPLVKVSTIKEIVTSYRATKKGIVYPSYQMKKGHPPVISSKYIADLLSFDGTGGLKAFLKKYDDTDGHFVNVEDEGILLDMDYYKEYEVLKKQKPI